MEMVNADHLDHFIFLFKEILKSLMAFSEFTFTWKIKNFDMFESDFLLSPEFNLGYRNRRLQDQLFVLKICKDGYLNDVSLSHCGEETGDKSNPHAMLNFSVSVTRSSGNSENIFTGIIARDFSVLCWKSTFASMYKIRRAYLHENILTLKCDFKSNGLCFSDRECSAGTEIVVETVTGKWEVANIFSEMEERKLCLPLLNINLVITPRNNEICPYLFGVNYTPHTPIEKFLIFSEISAENANGKLKELGVVELKYPTNTDTCVLGLTNSAFERENFYPHGNTAFSITFRIRKGEMVVRSGCFENEIEVVYEVSGSTPSRSVSPETNNGTVLESMRYMYEEQIHSDCVLKAGGKMFPVHKSILSAHSPVFRALFHTRRQEETPDKMQIDDIEKWTMDTLLRYIYYEKTPQLQDFSSCVKLYMAADRFEIPSLRKVCIGYMQRHPSPENACEALKLAEACNDDLLKQKATEYVSRNWSSFKHSPEFSKLVSENAGLASSITLNMAPK